jgi:hypothetical protein
VERVGGSSARTLVRAWAGFTFRPAQVSSLHGGRTVSDTPVKPKTGINVLRAARAS